MEIQRIVKSVKSGDILNLYFLGDIHEGNINHDDIAFKYAIDMIEKDDNAMVFLMGDYIEAITPDDKKRFNPITIANQYGLKDLKDLPYKQIEAVFDKLRPIQNKIKTVIIGNHEEAYMKHHYSDIYQRFIDMFDNKPTKMGYVGMIDLGLCIYRDRPNVSIKITLNHGVGGGGYLPGYPINKVHQVFRWTDSDINVMGHIHRLCFDTKNILTINDGKMRIKKRIWGASGCFMNTYVEGQANYYEAQAGFEQVDIGMFKVRIEAYSRSVKMFPELIKLN